MLHIDSSRRPASQRRRSDLRFAGIVSAGMIATVLTLAALLAPLLAWNGSRRPRRARARPDDPPQQARRARPHPRRALRRPRREPDRRGRRRAASSRPRRGSRAAAERRAAGLRPRA